MKTEIEYQGDNLLVKVKGNITSEEVVELKRRLNHIYYSYGPLNVVIDLKEVKTKEIELVMKEFSIYELINKGSIIIT